MHFEVQLRRKWHALGLKIDIARDSHVGLGFNRMTGFAVEQNHASGLGELQVAVF